MAETEETRDTVSREAHERVTRERDALKEQISQASGALSELQARYETTRYFGEKGVPNWHTVAEYAAPFYKGETDEDRYAALDRYIESHGLLSQKAEQPEPEASTEPPPVPKAAAPNPANRGESASRETLSYTEWRKANPRANMEEAKQAIRSGQIAVDPLNTTAQQAQRT